MQWKLVFLVAEVLFFFSKSVASQVSIEVPDPSSRLSCATRSVQVSFQSFTVTPCRRGPAVFERYSVSQEALDAILRHEKPGVTEFFKCAELVAQSDGDAFTFSDGVCQQTSVPQNLTCRGDVPVYVRQDTPDASADLVEKISDEVYRTRLPFSDSLEEATVTRVAPLDCADPAPMPNEFAVISNEVQYFDLSFYDPSLCAVKEKPDSVVVYFHPNYKNDVYFLLDYCGGSVPIALPDDKSMYSHRGYGCLDFPDEQVLDGCEVKFNMVEDFEFPIVYKLKEFIGNDSCGGLNITYTLTTKNGVVSLDFCDADKLVYLQSPYGFNHSIYFVRSGAPTRPKFGFELFNSS